MNKTILGLTALAIGTGVIFASASNAFAYRGDPAVKGPNYTAERHIAMEKAFENKDFSQWITLMQGKGRVTQVINNDNFAKFAEAHALAEDGKLVEAIELPKLQFFVGTQFHPEYKSRPLNPHSLFVEFLKSTI